MTLTRVGHPCGTHLQDTLAKHSCRTLLWDTLVQHSCMSLLWDTLVRRTLLWHTLVGHSCRTLLSQTPDATNILQIPRILFGGVLATVTNSRSRLHVGNSTFDRVACSNDIPQISKLNNNRRKKQAEQRTRCTSSLLPSSGLRRRQYVLPQQTCLRSICCKQTPKPAPWKRCESQS